MRVLIDDPKAADVNVVLLDGKIVKMAIAFDTDEGWVDVMLPKKAQKEVMLGKQTKENYIPNLVTMPEFEKVKDEKTGEIKEVPKVPATSVEWETKRLHGDVEIIWRKDESR